MDARSSCGAECHNTSWTFGAFPFQLRDIVYHCKERRVSYLRKEKWVETEDSA